MLGWGLNVEPSLSTKQLWVLLGLSFSTCDLKNLSLRARWIGNGFLGVYTISWCYLVLSEH